MSSVQQVQSSAATYVGSYDEARHIPAHDKYPDMSAYESRPDLELRVARQRYGNNEISHEEYFATMGRCLRELAGHGDKLSALVERPRLIEGAAFSPRTVHRGSLGWAGELIEMRPRLMAKLWKQKDQPRTGITRQRARFRTAGRMGLLLFFFGQTWRAGHKPYVFSLGGWLTMLLWSFFAFPGGVFKLKHRGLAGRAALRLMAQ